MGCKVREIPGFDGCYAAENGTIWSRWCQRGIPGKKGSESYIGDWRPIRVRLRGIRQQVGIRSNEGRQKSISVSYAVLTAFVGPRPPGMECCHYPDRNPCNNHLSNLRWDTKKANEADKRRHGTVARGESGGNSKLTESQVRQLFSDVAEGMADKQAAVKYGISPLYVGELVRGESWAHLQIQPVPDRRRVLNPELVRAIRARHAEVKSCRQVGQEFGIDQSQVHNIVRRKQWAWVE